MDQNAVFTEPPEETFILSPNHPYPYPWGYEQVGDMSQLLMLKLLTLHMQTWVLQSTTGRNIDIRFASLDLRNLQGCTGGYLEADM